MNKKKTVHNEGLFDSDELFKMMAWAIALVFCLTFWVAVASVVYRSL